MCHQAIRTIIILSSISWRDHSDVSNSLWFTLWIKCDHIAGPLVMASCFDELRGLCGLCHLQIPAERAHSMGRFGCCCYYYSFYSLFTFFSPSLMIFLWDLSALSFCQLGNISWKWWYMMLGGGSHSSGEIGLVEPLPTSFATHWSDKGKGEKSSILSPRLGMTKRMVYFHYELTKAVESGKEEKEQ